MILQQHVSIQLGATVEDYDPKELVVVDTGPEPSAFFQEKAQEDPRIIYRNLVGFSSLYEFAVPTEKMGFSHNLQKIDWITIESIDDFSGFDGKLKK